MKRRRKNPSSDSFMWIALGIVAYYFFTRPSSSAFVYPPNFVGPIPQGGISYANAVAQGIIAAGRIISTPTPVSSLPQTYPTATGGATDVTNINQIGPQPANPNTTGYSSGCVSNGNVCDPNDCDYNDQVCQEMGLSS
jgi:hypothetical protein